MRLFERPDVAPIATESEAVDPKLASATSLTTSIEGYYRTAEYADVDPRSAVFAYSTGANDNCTRRFASELHDF